MSRISVKTISGLGGGGSIPIAPAGVHVHVLVVGRCDDLLRGEEVCVHTSEILDLKYKIRKSYLESLDKIKTSFKLSMFLLICFF